MTDRTAATTIVVTHQSETHIAATLDALLHDPEAPDEVIVVDNGSDDGTERIVASRSVRWLPLGDNRGYGAAVNAGFTAASHPVVAVINDDVEVTPGWLPPLMAALEPLDVAAAMPTIELADRPGHFNTSGGAVSVSGVAWVTDLGAPVPEDEPAVVEVPFPSGAAFAMRAESWERLGGLREDMFMYHEDTDLGWRAFMRGMRTVRVTGSKVRHHYDFARNPRKLALLEANRLRMITTNYRRSTLLLLLPVLLIHEAGVLWVAARDRWLGAKLRAWATPVAGREARRHRRSVQASRIVGDAAILDWASAGLGTIEVGGVRVPRGAGVVDRLCASWITLIKPIVRAGDRRLRLG